MANHAAPAGTTEEVKMPGEELRADRMGVEKHTKIVRILTVIAYVCSVSAAAVMLSLYYLFLWTPNQPNHVTPSSLVFDENEMADSMTTTSPILNALVWNLNHESLPKELTTDAL